MHIFYPLHPCHFSAGRGVDLECGRHAGGRTNMPISSSSFSLLFSLSLSHSHTAGHLVNPDLLQAVHNGSSKHICSQQQIPDQPESRCWTAALWMPGSIVESLPRALASINTSRKPERTKKTSTRKHMPCSRNYVRAVCVFMHPHTFFEPCV